MNRGEPWAASATSNDRKGVTLPQKCVKAVKIISAHDDFYRIKCKICQKFKDPSQYSKNELGAYASKFSSANRDPNNSIVRCRICTGAQPGELQCEGPCGKVLKLNNFSKASRKAGGNMWCQSCTLWKESVNHITPLEAPPTGEFSDNATSLEPIYDSDPEAGDLDETYSLAPTALTITIKATAPNLKERSSPAFLTLPYSSLSNLRINNNTENPPSSGQSEKAASGMTGNDNFEQASQSSMSNPFLTSSSSVTATQVGQPVHYTAYDNTGVGHAQVTYSSGPRNIARSRENENAPPHTPVIQTSRSGWAKPIGQRNAAQTQPQQAPVLQPKSATGQYRYSDSSDSEDLM